MAAVNHEMCQHTALQLCKYLLEYGVFSGLYDIYQHNPLRYLVKLNLSEAYSTYRNASPAALQEHIIV